MRNWDDLQTILALGRSGTMKGAAVALGVSETTVSRRIQKITDGDGGIIFDRNGQSWKPTALGRGLIAVAERVEGEIIAAETQLEAKTKNIVGALKINSLSFINTHFLSPHVARFQLTHPDVTLTIDASDDVVSLAYRQADIALRLTRPTEGRLIAKKLCTLHMAAFARRTEKPRDWVGLIEGLDWTPEMKVGFNHFKHRPSIRLDGFDGILNVVEATGLGGVAPTCIARSRPQLTQLSRTVPRDVWLTYHEDMRNSPRVRAGVDWLDGALGRNSPCMCSYCDI
ncbi:MAG: LysR family transcriptional regulator [Pikeienuella sp.]